MLQFDPNLGPLFTGEFTKVLVKDPAQPGHGPNHVLDPSKPFTIEVEWKLEGSQVALFLAALGGNWAIEAFAESLGPGPELRIAAASVAAGPPAPAPKVYNAILTVPANTLPEGGPSGPAGPSGVYKIVIAAFLDSALPGPGFDICGFAEGPIIKVENPI